MKAPQGLHSERSGRERKVQKTLSKLVFVGLALALAPAAGSAKNDESPSASTAKQAAAQLNGTEMGSSPSEPAAAPCASSASPAPPPAMSGPGLGPLKRTIARAGALVDKLVNHSCKEARSDSRAGQSPLNVDGGTADLGGSSSFPFANSSSGNGGGVPDHHGPPPAPVPEPAPILLFGTGLLFVGCMLRRRITAQKQF